MTTTLVATPDPDDDRVAREAGKGEAPSDETRRDNGALIYRTSGSAGAVAADATSSVTITESGTTTAPLNTPIPAATVEGFSYSGLPERHWTTKDSGVREEFDTGSVRDTREGKGRYDLITPLGLKRVAGVYERGATKYKDRNWEKGQPLGRYLDSALRHIENVLEGLKDEDHAAQAAWNLLAFLHTEECIERGILPAELNDLPSYVPEATE